jgi:hypothetical protein
MQGVTVYGILWRLTLYILISGGSVFLSCVVYCYSPRCSTEQRCPRHVRYGVSWGFVQLPCGAYTYDPGLWGHPPIAAPIQACHAACLLRMFCWNAFQGPVARHDGGVCNCVPAAAGSARSFAAPSHSLRMCLFWQVCCCCWSCNPLAIGP